MKESSGFFDITIISGTTVIRRTLKGSSFTIGRAPDADLVLDNSKVSRIHLKLFTQKGQPWIEDLGSRNGTLVKGRKLIAHHPEVLPDDAEIQLVQTGMSLRIRSVISSPAEPVIPKSARTDEPTVLKTVSLEGQPPTQSKGQNPPPQTASADSERLLNEARRAAIQIINQAQIQAEKDSQDMFLRAQDAQTKAQEYYRQQIDKADAQAAQIFENSKTEGQSLLQEARSQAQQLRMDAEAALRMLHQRSEEAAAEILFAAEEKAAQMKREFVAQAAEVMKRKEEVLMSTARERIDSDFNEHEARITALSQKMAEEKNQHVEKMRLEEENWRNHFEIEKKQKKQELEEGLERSRGLLIIEQRAEVDRFNELRRQEKLAFEREIQALRTGCEVEMNLQIAKFNDEMKTQKTEFLDEMQVKRTWFENEMHSKKSDFENEIQSEQEKFADQMTMVRGAWSVELKAGNLKIEELRKQLATLKSEIERDQVIKKSLESECQSLDGRQKSLLIDLEGNNKKSNELQIENEKLHSSIEHLNTEIAAMTLNLEKKQMDYQAQSRRSALVSEELTDLQTQIAAASADQQAQLLNLKSRFEEEARKLAKQEDERGYQLKLETTRKAERFEKELMTEIRSKKEKLSREIVLLVEVAVGKDHDWGVISNPLQEQIARVLDGEIATGSNDQKAKEKRKQLLSERKRSQMALACAGILAGVLGLGLVQTLLSQLNQNPSPIERKLANETEARKQDLEQRKFSPPQVTEVKATYVEAVVYTRDFAFIYQSEAFQEAWSREATRYLLKTWRIQEDTSIQVVAASRTLVKSLTEKREGIHPDFVKQGLQKMQDLESESVARIRELLGGQVRYESFKKAEKKFFESYQSLIKL